MNVVVAKVTLVLLNVVWKLWLLVLGIAGIVTYASSDYVVPSNEADWAAMCGYCGMLFVIVWICLTAWSAYEWCLYTLERDERNIYRDNIAHLQKPLQCGGMESTMKEDDEIIPVPEPREYFDAASGCWITDHTGFNDWHNR